MLQPKPVDVRPSTTTQKPKSSMDICIDLLCTGHVNSYINFYELCALVPDTDYITLQTLLKEVEDSHRSGTDLSNYHANSNIAQYFMNHDKIDLALKHFTVALQAGKKLVKEYQYELDGTCNLALAIQKDGNAKNDQSRLQEALQHFERARELAILKEDTIRIQKCLTYLMELLTQIAKQHEAANMYDKAIPIYDHCLRLLKDKDPKLEHKEANDIILHLGKCYKIIGNIEEAVKNLEQFLQNQRLRDSKENEGTAQLLLASCYESSGKQSLAISYLELFIAQAQNDPSQRNEEAKACLQIAILQSKMKKYAAAVTYFEKHLNLVLKQHSTSKPIGVYDLDTEDIRLAKVQLGIARAKAKMDYLFETVADTSGGVGALIQWKAKGSFGDYVPPVFDEMQVSRLKMKVKDRTYTEVDTFPAKYAHFCKLYNTPIQSHVLNHSEHTLFLDIQRIKKDEEWKPILRAIRRNRELVRITFHVAKVKPPMYPLKHTENAKPVPKPRDFPDLIMALKESLLLNTNVQYLELSGIHLQENSIKTLTKGLWNHKSIRHLSLSRCKIGDSGLFILAPALRSMVNLTVLNLSACALTEKGAHILASFLKSLSVKRQAEKWEHTLRDHDKDPYTFKPVAKTRPDPLKRLNLCCNNLGDVGCAPILDLIQEEVGLRGVDLQHNHLTFKSAKRILEILDTNNELVILDVRNNDIDVKVLDLIQSTMDNNTKLMRLKGRSTVDIDLIPLDGVEPLKPKYYDEYFTKQASKSSLLKPHKSAKSQGMITVSVPSTNTARATQVKSNHSVILRRPVSAASTTKQSAVKVIPVSTASTTKQSAVKVIPVSTASSTKQSAVKVIPVSTASTTKQSAVKVIPVSTASTTKHPSVKPKPKVKQFTKKPKRKQEQPFSTIDEIENVIAALYNKYSPKSVQVEREETKVDRIPLNFKQILLEHRSPLSEPSVKSPLLKPHAVEPLYTFNPNPIAVEPLYTFNPKPIAVEQVYNAPPKSTIYESIPNSLSKQPMNEQLKPKHQSNHLHLSPSKPMVYEPSLPLSSTPLFKKDQLKSVASSSANQIPIYLNSQLQKRDSKDTNSIEKIESKELEINLKGVVKTESDFDLLLNLIQISIDSFNKTIDLLST